ncbi:L1TD1: LINE-1 type transposase domain-containing protein 1 [Crotalus adamanteus]|uniref:L1TD1: LINE-1 type transposase domain-containing protein 1 n=1 Tax=Crotalus adamanteus TaxID=8729 RepID=A0AAW1BNC5_CROAD
MDVRITDLVQQNQDMKRNITEMKTQMGEDKVLKSQTIMMHQVKKDLIEICDCQRRSNLRISGYPEKSEENETKLIQAVLDWATLILQDVPFTRYDIDLIHSQPKKVGKKIAERYCGANLVICKKRAIDAQIVKHVYNVWGASDTSFSSFMQ